jgi:hypothetical protein
MSSTPASTWRTAITGSGPAFGLTGGGRSLLRGGGHPAQRQAGSTGGGGQQEAAAIQYLSQTW